MIYFLYSPTHKAYKIGKTQSLRTLFVRWYNLERKIGASLTLSGFHNGDAYETALHAIWQHYRVDIGHGNEWFTAAAEITYYITEHCYTLDCDEASYELSQECKTWIKKNYLATLNA